MANNNKNNYVKNETVINLHLKTGNLKIVVQEENILDVCSADGKSLLTGQGKKDLEELNEVLHTTVILK
jgi:hypothetical protein